MTAAEPDADTAAQVPAACRRRSTGTDPLGGGRRIEDCSIAPSDRVIDHGTRPAAAAPVGRGPTAGPALSTVPVRPRPPDPAAGRSAPEPSIAGRPARAVVATLARCIVEVNLGIRAPQTLAAWMAIDVQTRLVRRAELNSRLRLAAPDRPGPPRRAGCVQVLRTRVCEIGPDCIEANATVADTTRTRAVALRLQRMRGTWRVTALELG